MSIRLIAKDLYRLLREVEQMERRLAAAPMSQRPALEDALRKLRAERDLLRRILDGNKDQGSPPR